MKLIIFSEIQLDVLRVDGLIVKRDLGFPEEAKKYINPNFLKHYPEYAITSKGMEFLNSIEVRDLSKKIELLTRILLIFGIVTILLMTIPLIFQILLKFL